MTDQGFTGKETVYLLELCLLRLSVLVHCVMQQNYCCPFGAMNLNWKGGAVSHQTGLQLLIRLEADWGWTRPRHPGTMSSCSPDAWGTWFDWFRLVFPGCPGLLYVLVNLSCVELNPHIFRKLFYIFFRYFLLLRAGMARALAKVRRSWGSATLEASLHSYNEKLLTYAFHHCFLSPLMNTEMLCQYSVSRRIIFCVCVSVFTCACEHECVSLCACVCVCVGAPSTLPRCITSPINIHQLSSI